uniref:Uncharacterized protein n=1 Tax=Anopheles atroparvus TaxID=41427 RepID=A0AAG5D1N9_ANOAO
MLPSFNGNKKQLACWLNTAEETLQIFENLVSPPIFRIYFTAVLNKIEGYAKDVLCVNGNPSNFGEVREMLTDAIGDKKELSSYNCQLWHNRMEGSIDEHYKKTKQIVFNIKSLAKQNAKYNGHWDAINEFIDEYSLAAYISGLKKPYFGYAQAARPKSIEEAHAFLCKFASNESNRSLNTETNFVRGNNLASDKTVKPDTFAHKAYTNNTHTNKSVQPMETSTTKSRLTQNRGLLNNNECVTNTEDEELMVNFWVCQDNNPAEILERANNLFSKAKQNLEIASKRQINKNVHKQEAPNVDESAEVFVMPNLRTKTQPRAYKTIAKNVDGKMLENIRGVKRHMKKIKRFKGR